jgi:hypothetical protein
VRLLTLHDKGMRPLLTFLGACLWLLITPPVAKPVELTKETAEAWNRYIQETKARIQPRLTGRKPFLWIDNSPERKRHVRQGEIVVEPAVGNGERQVPHGLIHDWIGAVFIPNVTLGDVFEIVHDFNHYNDFYKPEVIDSRLISHEDDQYKFFMRLLKKVLFVTAVFNTYYQSEYFRLSNKRWYSHSFTTRINQVEDYGKPDQHQLPEGQGSGYLWRLYGFSDIEERDAGVYIELEAIALSRDIPFLLHWLVDPVVRNVSKNSLEKSLDDTRKAVLKQAGKVSGQTQGGF